MNFFRYYAESIARFILSFLIRLPEILIVVAVLIVIVPIALVGETISQNTRWKLHWLESWIEKPQPLPWLDRKLEKWTNYSAKVRFSDKQRVWNALSKLEKDEEKT